MRAHRRDRRAARLDPEGSSEYSPVDEELYDHIDPEGHRLDRGHGDRVYRGKELAGAADWCPTCGRRADRHPAELPPEEVAMWQHGVVGQGALHGIEDNEVILRPHDHDVPLSQAGWHRRVGGPAAREHDEAIFETICDRMTEDPALDASEVAVHVEDEVVYLTGSVIDRRDRRRCEEIAWSVPDVADVENRLRLRRPQGPPRRLEWKRYRS